MSDNRDRVLEAPSMETTQIQLLRVCSSSIEACLSRVSALLGPEDALQGEEYCLYLGLRHGHETIRAAILLLENHLFTPATAMSRGFVESAIRLRWASLEKDGWERLVAGLAAEQIKWSENFCKHHDIDRRSFPVLQQPEIRQLVNDYPQPPDVAQLLDRIFELEPVKPEKTSSRKMYYGIFWLLHSAAHGSPALLSHFPKDNPAHDLDVFLAFATQLAIAAAESLTGECFRDEARSCSAGLLERMQRERSPGQS